MSEYYAVQRSTDHLAHYGVKGMKWGVRKALLKGNERALDRNFRRAARKLRKLQDIALKPKKYAAKAAAYGIAATGTGTIAIGGGTSLLSKYIRNKALGKASLAKSAEVDAVGSWKEGSKFTSAAAKRHVAEANKLSTKADKIDEWGNYRKVSTSKPLVRDENGVWKRGKEVTSTEKYSRNDKIRMAAGAATLGLAGMSALNAYRASHPQKYREKAVQFKNAMDEAFSGTKYSGQYVAGPRRRKRKKGR